MGNKANTAITPADAGSSGVVTAPVPLDSTCGAILHNEAGAPLLPEGMSASISHKHHLAVALVQKAGAPGHLGALRTRLPVIAVPTLIVYGTGPCAEPSLFPESLEIHRKCKFNYGPCTPPLNQSCRSKAGVFTVLCPFYGNTLSAGGGTLICPNRCYLLYLLRSGI